MSNAIDLGLQDYVPRNQSRQSGQVPGGVLIKDKNGTIFGAVGVSGDTSDNDEIAALAGIAAASLADDGGQG